MKSILAPIDFSPVTTRVINHAVSLARALGAKLVLMHVDRIPAGTSQYAAEMGGLAELTATIARAADRRIAALEKKLQQRGFVVDTYRRTGYPAGEILDLARKLGVDYIVLGSHGHGAFFDLVIGGTASAVIKKATCPVIVVPSSGRKSAGKSRPKRSAAARSRVK